MISAARHYPDHATQLANHEARIEGVEKQQDGLEKKFNDLTNLIICTLLSSVGALLGTVVLLLKK